MEEEWSQFELFDQVFFMPRGQDEPRIAECGFIVFAQSRPQAEACARVHLCVMVNQSGIGEVVSPPEDAP